MAFSYDPLSPIAWVSSVSSPTTSQMTYILSPSKFDYELEDVSKADAGRTEDGNMVKMRIGQVNKLLCEWQNVSTPAAKDLMQAFQAETFWVDFLDPFAGRYHVEKMYRGNISASMYSNWNNTASGNNRGKTGGIWTVSFSLIRVSGSTEIGT